MGTKRSDFAGSWYPGTPRECRMAIEEFASSAYRPHGEHRGLGGIVPHAGWYFSGRVALSVFAAIGSKASPSVFFVFGRHLPPNGPNTVFVDEGFDTPLGTLPAHAGMGERLSKDLALRVESSSAVGRDNTVELQLPFIRHLFPDARVVVLGVSPDERAVAVGERCAELAAEEGTEACYIGSTDLTHYGPNYGFTPKGEGPDAVRWVREENDRRIVEALLAGDPRAVLAEAASSRNACCPGGAAAAVAAIRRAAALRRLGLPRGSLVRYTTSGDVRPDNSFVGYAGVVF